MLLRILPFFSLIGLGGTLQCYICGDNDLGEFDECKTQFQYDCSSYAKRFGPNEKVYCRTTRHRAKNNTYTIIKECIAESDHYLKFPEKEFSVDEECDLVEIDGEEVAYCLCRKQSMCNQKPIAEQFMDFEQKHPELFGDLNEGAPEQSDVRSAPAVASAAFGTPQLQPEPILPVNDPRFSQSSDSSSVEIQREKLPSRSNAAREDQTLRNIGPKEMEQLLMAQGKLLPVKESASPGRIDVPVAFGAPKGSSDFLFSSSAIDGKPISGKKSREGKKEAPAPSLVLDKIPASSLKCAQCGQGELADENTDCESMVVDCQGTDTHCFTRQIIVGPGQNAVEKMCVSKIALENEYGHEVNLDGCSMSSGDKVRYCVCSTNECNEPSIIQQMRQHSAPEDRTPPRPVAEIPEDARIPATVAKETPDFGSAKVPIQFRESLLPIQPVNPVNQQPIVVPVMKEVLSKEMMLNENIVHQSTSSLTPSKAKNTPMGKMTEEPSLHCMICSESDITDPTTDCSAPVTVDCGAHAQTNEKFFCLSRQTQLSTGVFNMEKRCTTASEFAADFPDEQLKEGCASTFEGLVNFCVCKGDLCNKPNLLDQAQKQEVKEYRPSPTTTTVSPPRQWGGLVQSGPVSNNVDDQLTDQLVHNRNHPADVEPSNEEREIAERQKKWREVELSAGGEKKSTFSAFVTIFIMLLVQLL